MAREWRHFCTAWRRELSESLHNLLELLIFTSNQVLHQFSTFPVTCIWIRKIKEYRVFKSIYIDIYNYMIKTRTKKCVFVVYQIDYSYIYVHLKQ